MSRASRGLPRRMRQRQRRHTFQAVHQPSRLRRSVCPGAPSNAHAQTATLEGKAASKPDWATRHVSAQQRRAVHGRNRFCPSCLSTDEIVCSYTRCSCCRASTEVLLAHGAGLPMMILNFRHSARNPQTLNPKPLNPSTSEPQALRSSSEH